MNGPTRFALIICAVLLSILAASFSGSVFEPKEARPVVNWQRRYTDLFQVEIPRGDSHAVCVLSERIQCVNVRTGKTISETLTETSGVVIRPSDNQVFAQDANFPSRIYQFSLPSLTICSTLTFDRPLAQVCRRRVVFGEGSEFFTLDVSCNLVRCSIEPSECQTICTKASIEACAGERLTDPSRITVVDVAEERVRFLFWGVIYIVDLTNGEISKCRMTPLETQDLFEPIGDNFLCLSHMGVLEFSSAEQAKLIMPLTNALCPTVYFPMHNAAITACNGLQLKPGGPDPCEFRLETSGEVIRWQHDVYVKELRLIHDGKFVTWGHNHLALWDAKGKIVDLKRKED